MELHHHQTLQLLFGSKFVRSKVYDTLVAFAGVRNCCMVTVYPKKYAHGFVVLCFVVVMQSFIMNSHEVFIHIHQGCFAGTGAIVRLPQCQWSKPDGYGKISQCITTTKHSKAKTVCIFLWIYCTLSYCFFKQLLVICRSVVNSKIARNGRRYQLFLNNTVSLSNIG